MHQTMLRVLAPSSTAAAPETTSRADRDLPDQRSTREEPEVCVAQTMRVVDQVEATEALPVADLVPAA